MVGGKAQYKSAYWGVISVGTPAVKFKVVFDTGSGHIVLPSTYCHSKTCRAHRRYRRTASSSGVDIDSTGNMLEPNSPREQITVSFGTGEVTGVFMEEVVCLGGSTADQDAADLVARGLPAAGSLALVGKAPARPAVLSDDCMRTGIVIATDMSEDPFSAFNFDGILGLGLRSLSQGPGFNFLNMAAGSMLDGVQTFAIHLSEGGTEEGELTIGGYRQEYLDAPLTWNNVLAPQLGHWLLEVKSIKVDNVALPFCQEGCRAVADTGTSLLAVPPAVFPDLFVLMKHTTTTGLCNGPGPQLRIELENTVITLDPSDYSRLNETDNGRPLQGEGEKGICKPMMIVMDLPPPLGPKLIVLGEPVLRRYYTVYDAKDRRVGFGLSKQ